MTFTAAPTSRRSLLCAASLSLAAIAALNLTACSAKEEAQKPAPGSATDPCARTSRVIAPEADE